MFSIKLGLKNLTRQKRRNGITILVIAFAFFIYLFLDSVMGGLEFIFFCFHLLFWNSDCLIFQHSSCLLGSP